MVHEASACTHPTSRGGCAGDQGGACLASQCLGPVPEPAADATLAGHGTQALGHVLTLADGSFGHLEGGFLSKRNRGVLGEAFVLGFSEVLYGRGVAQGMPTTGNTL
jgi:hypothetical protein